ncbi:MAG: hypothetical protein U9R25_04025 [Chloroflexota bacterium]|nr:hypothetical protein [Chloroflexota bacterium]
MKQKRSWREGAWQRSAWARVEAAGKRLDGKEGETGQRYLRERGLEPDTWRAWRLGYVPVVHGRKRIKGQWWDVGLGAAIALPWIDGDKLMALQYRLIEHEALRYWQKAGGTRTLFGLHLVEGRSVLVACEGELNAVSIWQAARDWADVVSFGPQGNLQRALQHLGPLADRYEKVLVWADEAAWALAAAGKLGDRAVALRSPMGMDANDMLVVGVLGEFLQSFRVSEFQSIGMSE